MTPHKIFRLGLQLWQAQNLGHWLKKKILHSGLTTTPSLYSKDSFTKAGSSWNFTIYPKDWDLLIFLFSFAVMHSRGNKCFTNVLSGILISNCIKLGRLKKQMLPNFRHHTVPRHTDLDSKTHFVTQSPTMHNVFGFSWKCQVLPSHWSSQTMPEVSPFSLTHHPIVPSSLCPLTPIPVYTHYPQFL